MTETERALTRFWIVFATEPPLFDDPFDEEDRDYTPRTFGVTAYDAADALSLVQATFFAGRALPAVEHIIPDVDIALLNAHHILPGTIVPAGRRVWYPPDA